MMTVDHGWRTPQYVHSTDTWRPATTICEVAGKQVIVVANPAELNERWPVLSVDCGDAFKIETRVAGRNATVHARCCDQSFRINGTHGALGRGVALAKPMNGSRGAAAAVPVGTRLLGFAIIAKAPICDDATMLEIEAWLSERNLCSGIFGYLVVGNMCFPMAAHTRGSRNAASVLHADSRASCGDRVRCRYLIVDTKRSPAWLVNTPSFIEDHRFVTKPSTNLRFVYDASDPHTFGAYLVVNKKSLKMGDLLWWPYGQNQINSDIKVAVAQRKLRTPSKALIAKKAKKQETAKRMAAMRAAKELLRAGAQGGMSAQP